MRRSDIHRWREWPAAYKGELRQSIQGRLQGRWRSGIGARRPKAGCNVHGGQWWDRSTTNGGVRLDRPEDGRSLHAYRKQEAAGRRKHQQTERRGNIYSLT